MKEAFSGCFWHSTSHIFILIHLRTVIKSEVVTDQLNSSDYFICNSFLLLDTAVLGYLYNI